jgi:GNAT superfamily N-acetyltransferase
MIDPLVRRPDGTNEGELGQLRALEAEARAALVDQRGGPRWLDENTAVGDRWGEVCRDSIVWLAHIDEVVVGYIVGAVGDDRIARILDVYVTPGARELGFGDALLHAVIGDARRADATTIEGFSLPGDRATKNLYERAGIVARLITTSRAL